MIFVTFLNCTFLDLVAPFRCVGLWNFFSLMLEMATDRFCQPNFECGCCEMLVFRVCGVKQNFMFSVYCNANLDDRIYDCTLTSLAAVQPEDVRASFLFVGDLKAIIRIDWVL